MGRFRLATLNIEDFGDRHGAALPLNARISALQPLLTRLAADILCLQEVNAQRERGSRQRQFSGLDRLLEGTAYAGYARAYSASGGKPADVHNLVTLSRFPILAQRPVRHDYVTGPTWRPGTASPPMSAPVTVEWDRPILHTVHATGGDHPLHIINVHLRAPLAAVIPGQKVDAFQWKSTQAWAEGFYLAGMKRVGQALEARILADELFDSDADALLAMCGDFNAELAETPLRAAIASVEDTGNPALAGRALHPVEIEAPEASRYSVLHGGRRVLLDHLLVSAKLRARLIKAEVLSAGLADEVEAPARGEQVAGSFHAPVVAEFEL